MCTTLHRRGERVPQLSSRRLLCHDDLASLHNVSSLFLPWLVSSVLSRILTCVCQRTTSVGESHQHAYPDVRSVPLPRSSCCISLIVNPRRPFVADSTTRGLEESRRLVRDHRRGVYPQHAKRPVRTLGREELRAVAKLDPGVRLTLYSSHVVSLSSIHSSIYLGFAYLHRFAR